MPGAGVKSVKERSAAEVLPKQFVWSILALTALPFVLNLCGLNFGTKSSRIDILEVEATGLDRLEIDRLGPQYRFQNPEVSTLFLAEQGNLLNFDPTINLDPLFFVPYRRANGRMAEEKDDSETTTPAFYLASSGVFIHSILEWSAFCIALVTVVMAFIHYSIKHDVTTPIVGAALFCSGLIDAFNTLAADRLLVNVADYSQFVPFTWAISRTFNVCIMIVGTGLFLRRGRAGIAQTKKRGTRFVILVAILFGLVAYLIIVTCAVIPRLPQSLFPKSTVPRPWDGIPLVLFLLAGGIIFPRFHRMYPSQFSHGLIVSVVPHTAAQAYAAFGSTALYDNAFNMAYCLKILAYVVPLAGLLLDYTRAYHMEATFRATEEQLRIAREVQEGLFPQSAPVLPGYDMYGVSYPAEATGGDYFDYFPMHDRCWGIVIADVSGHDMGAALLMAQTRAYLRALTHRNMAINEMITRLNRFLSEDLRDKRFVSMFFAGLDLEQHCLSFTAAGHGAYLLHSSGSIKKLEATSPLLGVDEDCEITCGPKVPLQNGDIVVFITDGIIEAESREGIAFGEQRALSVVATNHDKPAREIVDALTNAVRKHCRNLEQQDDLTVVVLKKVKETAN